MSCNKQIDSTLNKMKEGTGVIFFDFDSREKKEHFRNGIVSRIKELTDDNLYEYPWLMDLLRMASDGDIDIWEKQMKDGLFMLNEISNNPSQIQNDELLEKKAISFARYLTSSNGLQYIKLQGYHSKTIKSSIINLIGNLKYNLSKSVLNVDNNAVFSLKSKLFNFLMDSGDATTFNELLKSIQNKFPDNDTDNNADLMYFCGARNLVNVYKEIINKSPYFLRDMMNGDYDLDRKIEALLLSKFDNTNRGNKDYERAVAVNLDKLRTLSDDEKVNPYLRKQLSEFIQQVDESIMVVK